MISYGSRHRRYRTGTGVVPRGPSDVRLRYLPVFTQAGDINKQKFSQRIPVPDEYGMVLTVWVQPVSTDTSTSYETYGTDNDDLVFVQRKFFSWRAYGTLVEFFYPHFFVNSYHEGKKGSISKQNVQFRDPEEKQKEIKILGYSNANGGTIFRESKRVWKRKGWEGCGTWRICITSDILLQFLHIYFQHGQLWTPGPATYTFKSLKIKFRLALKHVKTLHFLHSCTVRYLIYGTGTSKGINKKYRTMQTYTSR